jgi:hypothetical protein
MIDKVIQYFRGALEKPVYICAMVLDPTFKLAFWKVHAAFITTNNTNFAPGKNGNLSGGKHINFPEAFLQDDSGIKIRLK